MGKSTEEILAAEFVCSHCKNTGAVETPRRGVFFIPQPHQLKPELEKFLGRTVDRLPRPAGGIC